MGVPPHRIFSYFEALMRLYTKAGGKLVSEKTMAERYEICTTCEHFTGKGCVICGCCNNQKRTLFNKLAYPTEKCPDKPPRWNAEIE